MFIFGCPAPFYLTLFDTILGKDAMQIAGNPSDRNHGQRYTYRTGISIPDQATSEAMTPPSFALKTTALFLQRPDENITNGQCIFSVQPPPTHANNVPTSTCAFPDNSVGCLSFFHPSKKKTKHKKSLV
jgi:hypothetical protein